MPYSQATEPASASLSSKNNSEEQISAGFVKASAELIRTFPKNGPKNWGKKHGKSKIQTNRPENTEIENQRAQKAKRKYSGNTFEKETAKKKLIAVDSCEEEPKEFLYAELIVWKCMQKDLQFF